MTALRAPESIAESRTRTMMTLPRRGGLAAMVAAEAFSAGAGFLVLIRVARVLGPSAFGGVEFASATAGVALVLVRGGVESIAQREASRRPNLVRPIGEALVVAKIAMAAIGSAAIATASWIGDAPAGVMIAAGLVLWPSALMLDSGPRARGRLVLVAVVQVARAVALGAAGMLVRCREDAPMAAGLAAMVELVPAVVFGAVHVSEFGWPRARTHRRAACALLRRGLVASLSRLGRVFLYAADLLILARLLPGPALGPYAASRRVVLAVAALGLVLPSAMAPAIARAWAEGRGPARRAVTLATNRLMAFALPASVGLTLTAGGWISRLFGPEYQAGPILPALIAARLLVLWTSASLSTSLIAVRNEAASLRLVAVAVVAALITVPSAARVFGPSGAAAAMVAVEALASAGGWLALRSLGIAPPIWPADGTTTRGVAAMIAVVVASRGLPVPVASALGGMAYLAGRGLGRRAASS